MITALFFAISAIALFSALMVVISSKPIHSILNLIITFFAVAAHYLLLNAQFLAVVQIIVYAGAIMVLFLFVVMLLNLNDEVEPRKTSIYKLVAAVTGGLLLLALTAGLKTAETTIINDPEILKLSLYAGQVKTLGKLLFNEYLLPFELLSILFLAAMVGAVLLGKKQNA